MAEGGEGVHGASGAFSFLQSLRECPQVGSRYLHDVECSCLWVEHALFLNIRVPLPSGMTERVAPGIPEGCLLASFSAAAGHMR